MSRRSTPSAYPPRRGRPQRGGSDGLSLIEMVVALGIVTVILLATGLALVSMQSAQRVSEAADRATQLANDRLEQIRRIGWDRVGMDAPAPAPPAGMLFKDEPAVLLPEGAEVALVLVPQAENVKVGRNVFTVYTRVSWAPPRAEDAAFTAILKDEVNNSTGMAPPDGILDDSAKRVTLRVEWRQGTVTRFRDFTTLRYPTLAEAIPSRLGSGVQQNCSQPDTSPWCDLRVPSGMLVSNASGAFRVSEAFTITGVTRAPAGSAKIVVRGEELLMSNPTGDGIHWVRLLATGTLWNPGTNVPVDFVAGSADPTTSHGSWWVDGNPPGNVTAAAGSWDPVLTSPGPLRSAASVASTYVPVGDEPSVTALCVDSATGQLWNWTGLFFDVNQIDFQSDMGDEPVVTFTATRKADGGAARLPADRVGNPSGNVVGASTSNDPGTGVVQPHNPATAALNTRRWYAAFPAGTAFLQGVAATHVTVSQFRPSDGVLIQSTVDIAVKEVASSAAC